MVSYLSNIVLKSAPLLTRLILISSLAFCISACGPDTDYIILEEENSSSLLAQRLETLYGTEAVLLLPASENLEAIPADPLNPLTAAKVELGRLLFHETALGSEAIKAEGKYTYSCASCHHSQASFQSGMLQGIGEGGTGFGTAGEARVASLDYMAVEIDVQPIRTPTILNAAYQDVTLWNGQFGATGLNTGTEAQWEEGTPKAVNFEGFQGLETQAIAGMGVHRLHLEPEMLNNIPAYKELFDAAFPEVPEMERYSDRQVAMAIAAYERTVLSNQAPFQHWLRGTRQAMTESQTKGAQLFFGKAACYQCHSGPALNSESFHALGLQDFTDGEVIGDVDEATRKGRGGFTKNPADDYTFKTPTLYNLKGQGFLGHGGSVRSVLAMIEYKNEAIPENSAVPERALSDSFIPLGLTAAEIGYLTDFVENALHDPDMVRYIPERLPSGMCFPVADTQASIDLGCN